MAVMNKQSENNQGWSTKRIMEQARIASCLQYDISMQGQKDDKQLLLDIPLIYSVTYF